MNTAAR